MDVMFVWVTGQELGMGSAESQHDSKNTLTLACDGLRIGCESSVLELFKLQDMLDGFVSCCGSAGKNRAGLNLQEEEWGSGLTLNGIMPVTFQAMMTKYLKTRMERKIVDLSGIGGKAGDVVAMHMRRSEMLVWLTYSVVLKGMAFLLLDAQFGEETVCSRMADALSKVCVVDNAKHFKELVCVVPAFLSRVVRYQAEWERESALLYVLFTSGSTGRPKGVEVSQRNLHNYVRWHDLLTFTSCGADVGLLTGSLTFDGNLTLVFWPIMSNAILCILGERHCVPEGIAWFVKAWSIAFVKMVPSLVQVVFSSSDIRVAGLMMGGESVSKILVGQLGRRRIKVYNEYGPTECTVAVGNSELSSERHWSVHFGHPSINSAMRLERGQLLIFGPQVGRGYRNNLEKTKKAFVFDTFGNDGVLRIYDSGDKARFLETGDIEYLGRGDDQIKISGQRVELGAVESGVLSCAGVVQCAILVVDGYGSKSLVAFVVGATDAGRIREEVSRKAARHEVPHQIVMVDAIPLTTAGKADRAALKKLLLSENFDLVSAPRDSSVQSGRSKKSLNRSNSRKLVEDAVNMVLGKPVERSIWEAGATSLMAMQLDAAIKERTGVEIGLSNLMKDGSLDAITGVVDNLNQSMNQSNLSNTNLETQSSFTRLQRFGSSSKFVILVSGFGLLAETAMGIVNTLRQDFAVFVCEFAGLNMSPKKISELFFDQFSLNPTAIVAHSAGGVWAFEFAKHFKSAALVMLDCYVPPLSSFSKFEMMRFLIVPFRKMSGLPPVDNVPDQYLLPILRYLWKSHEKSIVEAYTSDDQFRMIEMMNQWKPEGMLNHKWIFVKCSSSKENVKDWMPFFELDPLIVSVDEDHFEMIKTAGSIILPLI